MARPSKRSFQQKVQPRGAGRSRRQRGEEEALRAAIEALGVSAEGDADQYQLQDSTDPSSDEDDTDIFDGKLIQLVAIPAFSKLTLITFPGDVFQQIPKEAKTPKAFSGVHLKYIRGPEATLRTNERKAKEARNLASAAKDTRHGLLSEWASTGGLGGGSL